MPSITWVFVSSLIGTETRRVSHSRSSRVASSVVSENRKVMRSRAPMVCGVTVTRAASSLGS